jgi:predicted Fe-S protein YdhL (DUF1289 family)
MGTAELLPRKVWQERAACINEFKTLDDKPHQAKQLCRGCPVISNCLKFAIMYGERGIWGGTSDEERAAMLTLYPTLQADLRRQALALGYLEQRYTMAQYWEALRREQNQAVS